MFNISSEISTYVLQIPNDQNGNVAIVSASIVMPNGKVITDVASVYRPSILGGGDPIETARKAVLESIGQKAKGCIKDSTIPSQNVTQDDKNKFQGGGDKPASDKQISLIEKLSQEYGQYPERLSSSQFGKHLSALSGREADSLIKFLKK